MSDRGGVGERPDARAHASEPIRVARIIARLNIGGPAIHAALLTERLDPSRYRSWLIAGSEDPHEGNYLDLRQWRVASLEKIPELGREIRGGQDLVTLVKLIRLIRRLRPHVVHTHTAKAGTLGRLAAWFCRVPVIVHTYHGHVFHGYFSPAKTRLFVAIERWLARRTTCLVAVSEQERHDVLALGIGRAGRFTVVPLGLDLDALLHAERRRGELRAELRVPDTDRLVGIVARLVPIKQHERFIEMAARLASQDPRLRFVIVGDGERRAELEGLVAAVGLSAQTHFLGWRADLDRVYADLDVVVLTSRNEGSPVALIEAMAAARPIVSTRVGGVPDVVADQTTGLLVPLGDPQALADAVRRVLDDAALAARLGAAARAAVEARYDAQRLLADVDRLYQRLLAAADVRY